MSEGATTSFESILAGVQRLREGKAQAKDVQVQPQAERKPPEVRETQKRELIINAFNQRKQDFNRNEPSEVEDRKRKWGNASAQGKTVLAETRSTTTIVYRGATLYFFL
ncbi:hypothetical protein ACU8KH_03387 [Lachancea thermotolerans]